MKEVCLGDDRGEVSRVGPGGQHALERGRVGGRSRKSHCGTCKVAVAGSVGSNHPCAMPPPAANAAS